MHIVITRPKEDSLYLIEDLIKLGHIVTHLPVIKINKLETKKINLLNYQGELLPILCPMHTTYLSSTQTTCLSSTHNMSLPGTEHGASAGSAESGESRNQEKVENFTKWSFSGRFRLRIVSFGAQRQ